MPEHPKVSEVETTGEDACLPEPVSTKRVSATQRWMTNDRA